jgi:hypothetical protein
MLIQTLWRWPVWSSLEEVMDVVGNTIEDSNYYVKAGVIMMMEPLGEAGRKER